MNVAERVGRGAIGASIVARCLGAFRLQDAAGSPLPIRTRKARALLAVLAVHGKPLSRDALADLLWSDRGPAQARSSLRQTIHELQHSAPLHGSLLTAGREDVAASREALVTDLELIRSASLQGDWPRLQTLLEASETGLLTDLDGLDAELDDWLRLQRAQEPAKTLAMAVDAAQRCASEAGARAGLDLVGEILRLDPANEEATRLAMQLAHEAGDRVALHRHFTALRDRLREDYDAEPSPETMELLGRLSNGKARPVSVEPSAVRPVAETSRSRWFWGLATAVLAAVMIAGVGWLFVRNGTAQPAATVVAVLPFDQEPPDQTYLAAGLWEQTRAALTRNPSIRVLGRTTTAAMAGQKLAPDEYLKRFGVTHLLEGSVRRSGADLLVSVSLTRTSDGVSVWQDAFRGRMGEPFALQDAIASGIEGKLRARLAPGGGRRAEQIATTPEVYARYSEARELIASRQRPNLQRAEGLLREAVKLDSNYAPAWSLLGAAIFFNGRLAILDSAARAEGIADARRALAMAPNFAPAHATLALLQGEQSKEAEPPLRRAVALDPSYSEAWNWLGNSLSSQGRLPEAMAAWKRAIEIDPLLTPAVQNLFMLADESGDQATVQWLLRRITKAGAPAELITSIKVNHANRLGDYSTSLKLLMERGQDENGKPKRLLWSNWFDTLIALGYYDRLHQVTGCPEWYAPLVSGKALPPTTFEGKPVTPEEFWTSELFSTPASRTMINLGHSRDIVRLYRSGFRDADEFISDTDRRDMLPDLAANVAVALAAEGRTPEASYLLSAASSRSERVLRKAPASAVDRARLAKIRAAQGEREEALALLRRALRNGWYPNGQATALDLAQEPAFRALRGEPRFEAIRKRILDHIAQERAEAGPLKV